jgi:hypothetical protein
MPPIETDDGMLIIDPYTHNILIQGLGPILSREEATAFLMYRPPVPKSLDGVPKHIRLHMLFSILDLHLPDAPGVRLQTSIDLMLRQGYRYRDPDNPKTWRSISGTPYVHKTPRAPAMAAADIGIPGVGKTQAALRALSYYPQVIPHESFPHLSNGLNQMVWMSVDVPSSGRAEDLGDNLMMEWDKNMADAIPNYEPRFADTLSRVRRDGIRMLDEWRQVAVSHFLGILHLDEVQNFFQISTLERRRKRTNSDGSLELSIVEDKCLKWILNFMNRWQVPLLVSGTPDGVAALTKRMSNTQRISTGGFHKFSHFESAKDKEFRDVYLPQLAKHQYVQKKLPVTDELAELLIELTGGVKRILIALWIAAHKIAFERDTDDLLLRDFKQAAATYLAPLAPAVAALRSGNPKRLAQYEDLFTKADGFWASFWGEISS